MAKRRSDAKPLSRITVDWRYLLFYVFFFVSLILIALFGVMAET